MENTAGIMNNENVEATNESDDIKTVAVNKFNNVAEKGNNNANATETGNNAAETENNNAAETENNNNVNANANVEEKTNNAEYQYATNNENTNPTKTKKRNKKTTENNNTNNTKKRNNNNNNNNNIRNKSQNLSSELKEDILTSKTNKETTNENTNNNNNNNDNNDNVTKVESENNTNNVNSRINSDANANILVSLNRLCMNLLNHQIVLKLYHFQTKQYSSHKATDSYIEKYGTLLDRFLEVAQGIYGKITLKKYSLAGSAHNDDNIIKHLDGMTTYWKMKIDDVLANNTDLINIRDELIGDADQLKYILTFK